MGPLEIRAGDGRSWLEQPELAEHRAEPRWIAQHLAPVLVVDGVHEALDEAQPPRRGDALSRIGDLEDGLHPARDTTNART